MFIRRFLYLLRFYRFQKLLSRNFFICLISLLMPMVIVSGVAFYAYFGLLIASEREKHIDTLTAQMGSIDLIIENTHKAAMELSAKEAFRMFIVDDLKSGPKGAFPSYYSYRTMHEVYEYLVFYVESNSTYVDSIYLYSFQNDYILGNAFSAPRANFHHDTDVISAYTEISDPSADPLSLKRTRVGMKGPEELITLYRRVFGAREDPLGLIATNIKADYIDGIINQHDRPIGQNTYVFTDAQGGAIIPKDTLMPTAAFGELATGEDGGYRNYSYTGTDGKTHRAVLLTLRSDYSGWTYVTEIPRGVYDERIYAIIPTIAGLLLAIVTASVVIAMILSYKLFRPIGDILAILDTNNQGGEKAGDLFISNATYRAYADLKSIQGQLAARVSELNVEQARSLLAQINPHFIFNTLQAIRWKAVALTSGENDVSDMIDRLSEITRDLIDLNTLLVSVRQEIQYAKRYIAIMQERYNHAFTVNWDVSEDCMDAQIPKIVLQPVIENAIHHGIRSMGQSGQIHISIHMNDCIEIVVSDNGTGITEERISELKRSFETPPAASRHIGLLNVHRRLRLIYGGGANLIIERLPEAGCSVTLRIPHREIS